MDVETLYRFLGQFPNHFDVAIDVDGFVILVSHQSVLEGSINMATNEEWTR